MLQLSRSAENNSASGNKITSALTQGMARLTGYRFIETIIPVDKDLFISGYYHLEDKEFESKASTKMTKQLGCIISKKQLNSPHPRQKINAADLRSELLKKNLYASTRAQANNNFLISTYSKQQVMKKDIWSSLAYFLADLILFPLCAYLIIIFQGRYFINL